MGPKPRIQLADYERETSRFCVAQITREDEHSLCSEGVFYLGRSRRELSFWENMRTDDLILFVNRYSETRSYAAVVTSKSIVEPKSEISTDSYPFVLHAKVVGAYTYPKSERPPFTDDLLADVRIQRFRPVWQKCFFFKTKTETTLPTSVVRDDIEISCASSVDDFEFIDEIAKEHPFGPRRALVTLMATNEHGRLGAVLAEPAQHRDVHNRLAIRAFRSDYEWIRERAVTVVRIFSSRNAAKWSVHEALLVRLIELAPNLVDGPISIIDGVSYDYHPVAVRLGSHVEVPNEPSGYFYFWRPFNVPSRVLPTREVENVTEEIRDLLVAKREMKYWLATGPIRFVKEGLKNGAWAIRKSDVNTGRWRSLKKGDHVFLADQGNIIRGLGVVANTKMERVPKFEDFPLWIYFENDVIADVSVHAEQTLGQNWFRNNRGGIVPLEDIDGATLRDRVFHQGATGKMWVEPNPFLLPQTQFQVQERQIFVVQSWQLLDSVYPYIKEILTDAGYSVVYAGDRDGQVIFSDIWLMLNESEAILVDYTNRRPNVYLEYGMALVLGKPIIAITQNPEDIPSDTPNLKYIVYQDSLKGLERLKSQLPRSVQTVIADRNRMKAAT